MANRRSAKTKALTASDIKAARLKIGASQAAFGRHYFDVNGTTVSRWEADGPPKRGPGRRLLEIVIPPLLAGGAAGAELAR